MEQDRLSKIAKDLAMYYERLYPDRVNQAISEVEDITSGWEAELHSFIVVFDEEDRKVREERVARVYIGNDAKQKATKEFKVISELFRVGYPVPEVFHLETDGSILNGPFNIMERVRGRTLSEVLHGVPEDEVRSLMAEFTRIWVALHNLDCYSIFYTEFSKGDTKNFLDEVLALAKIRIDETGILWLQPVIDWLEERRAGVAPEKLCIIHWDYHTENVMLRDDGSLVVLDWTGARPGDYRADLAWTMLLMSTYSDPALRDIILETYKEVSGREVRNIEFFEVLAIGRRLMDVSASLTQGAEKMGMRPGALEMMRRDTKHLHGVYSLLKKRAGLRLPEFEELLRNLK